MARQVAILHPGALEFGAHAPGAFTGFASMPHQAVLTHGMGDLADCQGWLVGWLVGVLMMMMSVLMMMMMMMMMMEMCMFFLY